MAEDKGEKTFSKSFPQYKEGGEQIQPILEKTRLLSRRSFIKIPGAEGYALGEPRTLALRRIRRELVEDIKNTPKANKDQRKKIVAKGHARDILAQEFIANQSEITVDLDELGEQVSRYSVLPSLDRESRKKPPIFLIPGTSNDLEYMGMLPQEIAFEGRNVIFVGFPESWKGNVTDNFGKAAEESGNYEPHTAFFKKAIEALMNDQRVKDKFGDFDTFDLWGYSAGSVITAEILTDPNFRKQIANAALICPPNCVDQQLKEIRVFGKTLRTFPFRASLWEQWNALGPKRFKDAPKRNVTNRHNVVSNNAMRARKVRAYDALVKKVTKKDEWWNRDLQVGGEGKIDVIIYDKDKLTQGYKAIPEIKQNPNLNVIELSGSHQTCLVQPETLIAAVC